MADGKMDGSGGSKRLHYRLCGVMPGISIWSLASCGLLPNGSDALEPRLDAKQPQNYIICVQIE